VFPRRCAPVHLKKIRNREFSDLRGGKRATDMIIIQREENHAEYDIYH